MKTKIIEQKLKISPDYQYKALRYGKLFQRQWHRNRLNLIQYLNFVNLNDSVADVGCGSGNVVLYFARTVNLIIGFDYNSDSLDFLQKKIKEGNISNAEVFNWNILEKIPDKFKNFFDKIIMTEVIEHFEEKDIDRVLTNLEYLLKPWGQILITTPNYKASPWSVMEFLIDKFEIFPQLWGEQHRIKFTIKKIKDICKRHNFKTIKTGTFSLISPFMRIFGKKTADSVSRLEMKYLKCCGPQLFICIQKKEE